MAYPLYLGCSLPPLGTSTGLKLEYSHLYPPHLCLFPLQTLAMAEGSVPVLLPASAAEEKDAIISPSKVY